ncbi:hypothetical protein ALC62_03079 [Cyphomyrmex costatus]|uniref:Sushi domain-containing protein n=1 Tax=Cyphomyrmex costatus TaxID=456900 RepID=A0A151IM62_9HYME|nr:hypothetical protein ALC62_03079 [Cyphomyrmex costatus]
MSGLAVCLILLSTVLGILGDCPAVQPPQWGSVREYRHKDGTRQIVYRCETGRRLQGHKIATCTADGWNQPVPKCVINDDMLMERFRHELYVGDQPIAPDRNKVQIARDRLKALEGIDDLKKAEKNKGGQEEEKEKEEVGEILVKT